MLGAPGTTSIRASAGNFYTAIDALSIGVLAANAPYGTTYTSPLPPLFAHAIHYRIYRAEQRATFSL